MIREKERVKFPDRMEQLQEVQESLFVQQTNQLAEKFFKVEPEINPLDDNKNEQTGGRVAGRETTRSSSYTAKPSTPKHTDEILKKPIKKKSILKKATKKVLKLLVFPLIVLLIIARELTKIFSEENEEIQAKTTDNYYRKD